MALELEISRLPYQLYRDKYYKADCILSATKHDMIFALYTGKVRYDI